MSPRPSLRHITLRRLAERYAVESEVRGEVDKALGVFHVPPHPKGEG